MLKILGPQEREWLCVSVGTLQDVSKQLTPLQPQ